MMGAVMASGVMASSQSIINPLFTAGAGEIRRLFFALIFLDICGGNVYNISVPEDLVVRFEV